MLVLAILFLLLVVVFAVQNAQMVPITFMVWSFELNQALVVLGSACLGVIIGVVWAWLRGMSTRGRIKELTQQLGAEREKNAGLERTIAEMMNQREYNETREKEVEGRTL
ncbi:MAG: LapA family protein [Bacillota bacterium]